MKIMTSQNMNKRSSTQTLLKILSITCLALLLFLVAAFVVKLAYHWPQKGEVSYTLNPSFKKVPLESVVKILVEHDNGRRSSGSGILFSPEGYILTNAHVLTTPLGKKVKNIKICYSTENHQEVKCEYDARIIDADRLQDIAVIKVDREIREIKPYPFVIQGDEESWIKEILPLGSEIQAIGYPGVGGKSITITRGIVSGYLNGEITYDEGRLEKIPYFIKTDTEINPGNSGGAVFDKENRYVGMSTSIQKDTGGKLSYLISWHRINLYLHHLYLKGALKLPSKQYAARKYPSHERGLWEGYGAYIREDYKTAQEIFETYTKENNSDSRGLYYLCQTYLMNGDLENMERCAQHLRALNPSAAAQSWWFTSYYNEQQEKDVNKAYASIKKSVDSAPEIPSLLEREAFLEMVLNKNEEARRTIEKILDVDEMNYNALLYLGILAIKEQDLESAQKFLEISFDRNPTVDSATGLAEIFMSKFESKGDLKDLVHSMNYRVSSLVLDNKKDTSIASFISLADALATLIERDKNSWGNSIKLIKRLMRDLEVDKDLIEPLGGVTQPQIQKFLEQSGKKNEPIAEEKIASVRSFINMTMAWIYTLLEDKTACRGKFLEIQNDPNFLQQLIVSNISPTKLQNILARNIILFCLCMNEDYSNEAIKGCYAKNQMQVAPAQNAMKPTQKASTEGGEGGGW